jgi:hypothetical protein
MNLQTVEANGQWQSVPVLLAVACRESIECVNLSMAHNDRMHSVITTSERS